MGEMRFEETHRITFVDVVLAAARITNNSFGCSLQLRRVQELGAVLQFLSLQQNARGVRQHDNRFVPVGLRPGRWHKARKIVLQFRKLVRHSFVVASTVFTLVWLVMGDFLSCVLLLYK